MSSSSAPSSPVTIPPNAGFQDGGDFTLRSCLDETEFKVFRLFLMTASPVFQDILSGGSGPPVMDLVEDAETISALLQYIYPRENPTIKNYELFGKVLEAARKYELGFIVSDLRASMRSDSTAFSYLRANPLRMYSLAVRHELKEEILVAAKLTIGKYDFASRESALALADLNVPTHDAIMLMQMHMGRAAALTQLMANLDSSPFQFVGFPVKCQGCREKGFISELQRTWMKETVDALHKEPLEKAGRLFDKEYFLEMKRRSKCADCRLSEFSEVQYKVWVSEIRQKIGGLDLDVL
ncbi:hypothetical protein BDV93DRAFT_517459 [Ceratobasidium sp. AG-I]|nr:hypothetical protein BDV93DRAFT_517459 [Ceratobasidium sp. AG-I]